MDVIDELREIWTIHFPKRKEGEASKLLVVAFIEVIRKRAIAHAWSVTV